MKTYPYDWRGANPENAFTEDRVVDSEDAEGRVIVLHHRPFFAAGFSVTVAGSTTPLTLGADYQLVYRLMELEDSVASPVFCGVQILNPSIGGALRFSGQCLGESFYSPFVDILDELVKYLNNPVDVDWLNLDGRPLLYPPQPAATSWTDLVNKNYLASAVRDVEIDAGAANTAIKAKLTQLKNTIAALNAEMVALNYPGHAASHMAHSITVAQSGAHPVNLKTPDTFLAFGKTLRTLTAEIRALGLQQSDINNYIDKYASKDIDGVFVQQLAANRSLFKSKSGTSEVTFTDTAFTIKSNGSVVLSAGYLETDLTLKFMEWKSGNNTLRIESSGNALGMDKLTLNGKVLLTTNTLLEYQNQGSGGGTTDPDDTKVYINGGNGLAFTGKGSLADPIKGTLTLPTASITVKGIARLKATPGAESAGWAATPASLAPYEGKAAEYVPKATMLNSKPMTDTANRVVTKDEIGLGSVDNTSDLAKPISTPQKAELDALSATGHKHAWADLPLPSATAQQKGIATYTTAEAGLAASRGVAPNVLKLLSDRLDIIADALANVKTGVVTDFAAVNASSWTASSTSRLGVVDLGYFWQLDGERDDGVVSGSVDLQTTPMFQWYKPTNRLEDNWQRAVESTGTGLTWTGISKQPPLPLTPSKIGVMAADRGTVAVRSVLVKRRVIVRSGKLNAYIAAGGAITVYVNGESVASGNSPLHAEITLPAGDIVHTVAIRADCNAPARSAAIMYELYDGDAPLAASRRDDPIAYLQEFVAGWQNCRHYLYMSVLTGSLYSRAEPVESQGIDLDHELIGYIDVPAAGLTTGAKYTFGKMFDFGPSKEIAAHALLSKTHIPKKTDWLLADNPNMLLMGKTHFHPQTFLYGTDVNANPSNAMMFFGTVSPIVGELLLGYQSDSGQTPAQWFTPRNPKANGNPTFEGGLVLNVRQQNVRASLSDVDLVFLGVRSESTTDRRHDALRIKFDGSKPKLGFCSEVTVGFAGKPALPTFNMIDAPCTVKVVQQIVESNSNSAVALDKLTLKNQYPRAVIRYRYDCETRVLRVFQLFTPGGVEGLIITEIEFAFTPDMAKYFAGFTGMMFTPGSMNINLTMLPSIYPIGIAAFDMSKYQYLRSLFESYMSANVAVSTAEATTFKEVTGPFMGSGVATEWLSLPLDGGVIGESHSGYLPLGFWGSQQQPAPALGSALITWRGEMVMARGPMYLNPVMVGFQIPADKVAKKVTVTYRSSLPGQVWLNDAQGYGANFSANVSATASSFSINASPYHLEGGQMVCIQFNPPGGKLAELRAEFTIEVFDESNTRIATFSHGSPGIFYSNGRRYMIQKNSPFHITGRLWDWIKAAMATERQSDGTDYGQWG